MVSFTEALEEIKAASISDLYAGLQLLKQLRAERQLGNVQSFTENVFTRKKPNLTVIDSDGVA